MKRIRYLSEIAAGLGPAEIDSIGNQAAIANARNGITGLLVASGKIFFQIIEGPEDAINALWTRLSQDPRHQNILILAEEHGDLLRLCPDWAMRRVDLDHGALRRHDSLKSIMRAIQSQRMAMDELVSTLEQTVWHEFLEAEALRGG